MASNILHSAACSSSNKFKFRRPPHNSPQTLDLVKRIHRLNHLNPFPPLQHFILPYSLVSIHLGRPLPLRHLTVLLHCFNTSYFLLSGISNPPGTFLGLSWSHVCNLCLIHHKQCKSQEDHLRREHTSAQRDTCKHTGTNTQTSNPILSSNRHQVGRLRRELCQCVSVWVFPLLLSLSLSPSIHLSHLLPLPFPRQNGQMASNPTC